MLKCVIGLLCLVNVAASLECQGCECDSFRTRDENEKQVCHFVPERDPMTLSKCETTCATRGGRLPKLVDRSKRAEFAAYMFLRGSDYNAHDYVYDHMRHLYAFWVWTDAMYTDDKGWVWQRDGTSMESDLWLPTYPRTDATQGPPNGTHAAFMVAPGYSFLPYMPGMEPNSYGHVNAKGTVIKYAAANLKTTKETDAWLLFCTCEATPPACKLSDLPLDLSDPSVTELSYNGNVTSVLKGFLPIDHAFDVDVTVTVESEVTLHCSDGHYVDGIYPHKSYVVTCSSSDTGGPSTWTPSITRCQPGYEPESLLIINLPSVLGEYNLEGGDDSYRPLNTLRQAIVTYMESPAVGCAVNGGKVVQATQCTKYLGNTVYCAYFCEKKDPVHFVIDPVEGTFTPQTNITGLPTIDDVNGILTKYGASFVDDKYLVFCSHAGWYDPTGEQTYGGDGCFVRDIETSTVFEKITTESGYPGSAQFVQTSGLPIGHNELLSNGENIVQISVDAANFYRYTPSSGAWENLATERTKNSYNFGTNGLTFDKDGIISCKMQVSTTQCSVTSLHDLVEMPISSFSDVEPRVMGRIVALGNNSYMAMGGMSVQQNSLPPTTVEFCDGDIHTCEWKILPTRLDEASTGEAYAAQLVEVIPIQAVKLAHD